jgi:hypothetical protein
MVGKIYKTAVIAALVLFFYAGLLPAGLVAAENEIIISEDINRAAGELVINRNTVVNGNVTLNLGELTIDGIVNGDVSSNMGEVTVNGDVTGNVEANMGRVMVTGNVSGDVRSRLGEIEISGSVGGNVDADLGATRVGGTVGGNVGSGFGEMLISGTVSGNVTSKGGNMLITGIVDGDVTLEQGVVEIGPQGVVNGRIYVGRGLIKKADSSITGQIIINEELTISDINDYPDDLGYSFEGVDDVQVDSVVERMERSFDNAFNRFNFMPRMMRTRDWAVSPFPHFGPYGNVARGIINMLIMFALTALTYTLFPVQVKAAGEAVATKIGLVIGWGLLVALLAIPLMVVLAITIIGIPLIIVEIIILAVSALFGYTGIALLVGEKIIGSASSRSFSPLGAVAIGVLVLGLVTMIPFFGWLVSLALFVLAIGAALMTRFGSAKPVVTEIVLPARQTQKNTDESSE